MRTKLIYSLPLILPFMGIVNSAQALTPPGPLDHRWFYTELKAVYTKGKFIDYSGTDPVRSNFTVKINSGKGNCYGYLEEKSKNVTLPHPFHFYNFCVDNSGNYGKYSSIDLENLGNDSVGSDFVSLNFVANGESPSTAKFTYQGIIIFQGKVKKNTDDLTSLDLVTKGGEGTAVYNKTSIMAGSTKAQLIFKWTKWASPPAEFETCRQVAFDKIEPGPEFVNCDTDPNVP